VKIINEISLEMKQGTIHAKSLRTSEEQWSFRSLGVSKVGGKALNL
jgi:hypothetical protein